jgi:YebC/PmpR family DNA-binding regulatory protein
MSGHSKWSKVKHQKAVTDVVKGQAFTKAGHAITIAVHEGGGITDPDKNFRLRLAIELARSVNMPKSIIERAIAKAAGEGAGAMESLVYEAYGPGGVAILITAATDNRQRTIAAVKNVVESGGGAIASPGSVQYQFSQSGVVTVPKHDQTFERMEEVAIEAGADSLTETEDVFELYTNPHALHAVKQAVEQEGIVTDNAQLIMKPTMPVDCPPDIRTRVDALVLRLETMDDVHQVYTNLL